MDYVAGRSGNDDIRVTNNSDGTILAGNAGDDILRGGRFDDILVGGSGDDRMFGGGGADQFRFFGDQIDGASDLDKVFDLNFGDGDTLVFGDYGAGTFTDTTGENAFNDGAAAIISSVEGLYNAVTDSDLIGASRLGNTDTLVLTIDNGAGQTQIIHLSNLWDAYNDFMAV